MGTQGQAGRPPPINTTIGNNIIVGFECYGDARDVRHLLLHPVRLRIVQAFLGDRALTTTALREELADIPPTSLYRQVARLVAAGVLMVVAERRVRGAVERTYVLRLSAASVALRGRTGAHAR